MPSGYCKELLPHHLITVLESRGLGQGRPDRGTLKKEKGGGKMHHETGDLL